MIFPRITKILKIGDYVVILFLSFSGIISWIIGLQAREGSRVVIYSDGQEFANVSLRQNRTLEVPGPLGVSIVEVRNGYIQMVKSPCPHQLCVRMGAIFRAGSMIVCVPNRVFIQIPSDDSNHLDAITQ